MADLKTALDDAQRHTGTHTCSSEKVHRHLRVLCEALDAEPGLLFEDERQAAFKAGWDDAKAVISRAIVEVAPHPGEHHDFATTCLKCGENGMLVITLITHGERVRIEDSP